MRKMLSVMAFLLAAPALAHGPTPIKIDETILISADPKAVWAVAGKFDGLAAWHPDVQAVKANGGDMAGAEREVTLKKGGALKEGLDEYDATSHKLSWRMSDPNLDAMPCEFLFALNFGRAGGGRRQPSQMVWPPLSWRYKRTSRRKISMMTPLARRWRPISITGWRA